MELDKLLGPFTVFTTERLAVRPVEKGDLEYIHPCVTKKLTEYWTGWEPHRNEAETEKYIADFMKKRDNAGWTAFDAETGDFVGFVGISRATFPIENTRFELDIWIAEHKWGRGYATELTQTFLQNLAEHTALKSVIYSYTQGNEASRKIIKSMCVGNPVIVRDEQKRGATVKTYNTVIPLDGYFSYRS